MFKPGDQIGNYLLVNRIGRGGFGEVWLAERRTKFVTTKVALKLPLDEQVDYEDIKREAGVWEKASGHPNVLPIIEADEYDGQVVIVSEYAPDGSLDELLKRKGGLLSIEKALDMTCGVLSGLEFLHSKEIIHRDIKPGNILLQGDTPRLTDFGISRIAIATTLSNSTAGTPVYMAPEAFDGKRNVQTDLWSVGVLLYQLTTGCFPFASNSVSELMSEIVWNDPIPLPMHLTSILQPIIDRALDKNPAARYKSAAEMRRDLLEHAKRLEIGTVSTLSETIRNSVAAESQISETGRKTIAILPFKNLGGDQAMQFYEFSLADAVTTELARLRSLVVRPSSVISRYQGQDIDPRRAGREMKVNSILSAGFLHSGTQLRVTAQLLDVLTGEIIWSDRIDSKADDIFDMQDTITQRILDGLGFNLTTGEQEELVQRPTRSNEAYEEYLRGRDKFARFIFRTLSLADCEAAIQSFRKAVAIDPNFALAWSGIGACYANKVHKAMGSVSDYDEAAIALRKALDIDDNIVEARVITCFIKLAQGKRSEVLKDIVVLKERFPTNPRVCFIEATLHRLNGNYDQSLATWDRYIRLDPSVLALAAYNRSRIFTMRREFVEADRELNIASEAEPGNPMVPVFRSMSLYYRGQVTDATELLQKVVRANAHLTGFCPLLAVFLARLERRVDALAYLSPEVLDIAVTDNDIAYWTASAFALLEDREQAFDWLQKSIGLGMADVKWLQCDINLEGLRSDERFERMCLLTQRQMS